MKTIEAFRIAAIALAVLLAQLAWIAKFPHLRAIDLFVVFLLLLAAARGPLQSGVYAIIGGAVMDSFSMQYGAFHMIYYLIPVAAGTLFRSRTLLEYSQLGAATVLSLLLLKVLGQLIAGLSAGWLPSPVYIFKLNYLPLIAEVALVYACWPRLTKLIPDVAEGKLLA